MKCFTVFVFWMACMAGHLVAQDNQDKALKSGDAIATIEGISKNLWI